MKGFLLRNKVFLIILLSTCLIIYGGIALMTKGTTPQNTSNSQDVSVLVPGNAYITSGFSDNKYLPASGSATVTLVEFGDYVCPACGSYAPYVKKVLTDYAGKINYVFRNYPLSYHTNAPMASYAALAAGIQGKYWEMHDKLYMTQSTWSESNDAKSVFVNYASELGLNKDQFLTDMNSQAVKDIVSQDKKDGDIVGLRGTPTFYLNGKELVLNTFDELENSVSALIK